MYKFVVSLCFYRTLYSLILNTEREMEDKLSKKKQKMDKKKRNIQRHLTIEVNKYEPEIFRKLIQFVHCGTVEVDSECVTGMYSLLYPCPNYNPEGK